MGFSVGLGLTNDCDLRCAHCYRPRGKIHNLTLGDVALICETLDVDSVGLGTGENGLNPEYFQILDYFRERRIPVSLASNGLTVKLTPDEILGTFREVEFSLDFPTEKEQDAFRGEGNWKRVLGGIDRCGKLGIRVCVLAVLMNLNHDRLGRLANLVGLLGCDLRVNVFQPVQTRDYMPTYEQYWEAYRTLFAAAALLSCTEPLVHAFSGLNTQRSSPCGRHSIRITPAREVLPCVYWPGERIDLAELVRLKEKVWDSPPFLAAGKIPAACRGCEWAAGCGGGCRSRALLLGRGEEPDVFCPVRRGDSERLQPRAAPLSEPLLRSGSICTTIVRG